MNLPKRKLIYFLVRAIDWAQVSIIIYSIMKLVIISLMISVFVGSAILGPVAMNHLGGHERGVCGTAKAQGLESCFEFLSNFSATMINGGSSNFPILLSIILIITAVIRRSYKLAKINLILWRFKFLELFSLSPKNRITRWLALFENSPAFV